MRQDLDVPIGGNVGTCLLIPSGDVLDSGKTRFAKRPSTSGAGTLGYLWTRKTLLGESVSGNEEGQVDSSELAVDVDSITTGKEVVRGLERSLDVASNLRTLIADGDEEEEGGEVKRL